MLSSIMEKRKAAHSTKSEGKPQGREKNLAALGLSPLP